MPAPALMNMQVPPLQAPGINPQAMAMLQAALKQGQPGGGAPATPGLLAPDGGMANMMGGGMGNGLLSKMFPQAPTPAPGAPMSLAPPSPGATAPPAAGPIDPNTGLPVTPDVMAGAAGAGGPGPAPTALTGLW